MKKTIMTIFALTSLMAFATPFEGLSISAEIKLYESNKDKVSHHYNTIYDAAKENCDEMRVYSFSRQNRRDAKEKCRKEARQKASDGIKNDTVETLVRTLSTENESDKLDVIEFIRDKKNIKIYETMRDLREIANSDETRRKVQRLKELTGATKITFKVDVSLYEQEKHEGWYQQFTKVGKVYILADNRGPRWFYNLYPSYDSFDRGHQQSLAKEVQLILNYRIHQAEEKQIKENGLEDIVDDFSSLEEEQDNQETRFI